MHKCWHASCYFKNFFLRQTTKSDTTVNHNIHSLLRRYRSDLTRKKWNSWKLMFDIWSPKNLQFKFVKVYFISNFSCPCAHEVLCRKPDVDATSFFFYACTFCQQHLAMLLLWTCWNVNALIWWHLLWSKLLLNFFRFKICIRKEERNLHFAR